MGGISIMVFVMVVCTHVVIVCLVQQIVWHVLRVYFYGIMSALMHVSGDIMATMEPVANVNILVLSAVTIGAMFAMMDTSYGRENVDPLVKNTTMQMR